MVIAQNKKPHKSFLSTRRLKERDVPMSIDSLSPKIKGYGIRTRSARTLDLHYNGFRTY